MLELSEHIRIQLERCSDLPSLPAVAVQILKLAQSHTSTMGDVADAVGYDPALATKLLKIANSPLYGQRRKSGNIRQAVMLLGLNSTLMLTLSFSLFSSLRQQEERGLDYNAYWQRSLLSSTVARLLGRLPEEVSPEEAFLAALLQDIGMAVMDRAFDQFYQQMETDENRHSDIIEFERKQIDTDHAAVGAWLLNQWNFPEHLIEAVRGSHQTVDSKELARISTLTECIALSGIIADGIIAVDKNQDENTPDSLRLGDDYESLIEELYEEIPVVEGLFEMSLLDNKYTDKVLTEAKNQMLMRGLSFSQELNTSRQEMDRHEQRTQLLKKESMQDHLTGLSNRKHFDLALEEEFIHARKNGWPLSAIFIDLDKFKSINDKFGHIVGDSILKFSAKILSAYTRDQDAVFRYGGEEFLILLPGCSSEDATSAATRIVEAIRNNKLTLKSQHKISITCSAGVATLDSQHVFESKELLVEAADHAMYAAKQNGGDSVMVYQQSLVKNYH